MENNYLIDLFKHSKIFKFSLFLFVLLTGWWASIYLRGLEEGFENNLFTVVLTVFSLIGGLAGLMYSKKWGGYKSLLGRAIMMFSVGLLAQFVGYTLYSIYIYILGIEVPYPSFGDVFFLGSVFLYLYGSYLLAKVAGVGFSIDNIGNKLLAVLIPLVMLLISYYVFLSGYEPDWSNYLVVFLDFGYPVGQALYVSIALLAWIISKNILGGVMRKPIMFLIAALVVQYIADFSFSYQVARESWYVGGINDYLYALANFLMTLSLLLIGNMFYKVKES